ncbi:uncharacterized protein C3orf20 homolog [Varanus komodoensis]|uniref:uncharacterized protein C3orf20 homolog n=1 Tax=Varanus komodoensis TaxID=61221 RepID=UPI001CF7994E|nr:uncharacterized protein C3orf20 homolog [Varanus komodoensis]
MQQNKTRYKILKEKMAEMLEQGPIYFFDQPKPKRKWLKKMEPRLQLADLISVSDSLHETKNFYWNPGCTEGHMEGKVKSKIAKKDRVCPDTYGPSVSQATCEDPLDQSSKIPSDSLSEVFLYSTSWEEYKCTAVAILCELEEMLNHFSKSKFILPQGILNILNYSWKELTESVWDNEKSWQELTGKRQASEEPNMLSTTSKSTDYEVAKNIKRGSRKSLGFPTDVAKQTENPGILLKRTVVSQQYANNSPVAISFSLSSELCKERGWVFQHSDCDSKDPKWKVPYIWAVERLQLAKIETTEQLSILKESGFDKSIILRHYGDVRKETVPKNIKECISTTISSEALFEKPKLPVIKQIKSVFKKLHYRLIDGSSLIYYPSGNIAVCQSYSGLPDGGFYTNIFNNFPDRALLGTFTPFGHGSVCFPNSNSIAMIFNQEGGLVTNKDGEILRQWKWPGAGKLDVPVIVQVNQYITVRIAGRFAVCLVFKCNQDTVRLSLSPVRAGAVPQLENPETKIPGIPTGDQGHVKDLNATIELRKLKCKIKTILEDWMKCYWVAFEIKSCHKQRTSTFLQRGGRCKMQLADASLNPQITQGEKNSNKASVLDNPVPFQSASVSRHLLQHNVSSTSCSHVFKSPFLHHPSSNVSQRAPHLSRIIFRTNQSFITCSSLNKEKPQISPKTSDSEKACCASYAACPVALRNTMLGGEVKTCRCSSHQIPYVTDLEYNELINNQVSSPEQIMVVCVTGSLRATDLEASMDEHLEKLYERRNKNRSMPCIQGRLDSFRLLKYDINSADEFTDHCGPLLMERHNISPGMVLMYIQGKLLFANYIFNGYSKSVKDLQKQFILTRNNYNRGYYLPPDYRFSSLEKSLQTYPEYTQAST